MEDQEDQGQQERTIYSFHIQRVQALLPADFPPRIPFCQWFLRKIVEIPQLLNLILFTMRRVFQEMQ
ncbi:hypothetical protein NQ318_022938 [Aromia moschata]|uniref:Uncharacterized protein n=1 Tax=Aromia moschata TaxID=1265417 RepID=A0AAV8XCJ5_9CUCU|nr:hypothetical protein NQ318_022938 [Aromia moschata]